MKLKSINTEILIIISILVITTALSCSDKIFKLKGVYEASASGYRIDITAEGLVSSGSDVSEMSNAAIIICTIDKKNIDVINIEIKNSHEVKYYIASQTPKSINWDFRNREKSLASVLADAGYLHLNLDEVKETVRVIEGILLGNKGVILEGQTNYLKVVKVDHY